MTIYIIYIALSVTLSHLLPYIYYNFTSSQESQERISPRLLALVANCVNALNRVPS